MTAGVRPFVGALLTIAAIAAAPLRADTVQLSFHDGRLTLVAVNATPAEIFEAWSRAGGVRVVNAERMPATPLTLTMEDVPEEQGLDTVLRAVSGYMARRRPAPASDASIFDCIIIVPALAGARPPTTPGRKRVGLLGFSFKAGTDDLRESPMVILAESLLGKGCTLKIYDRNVSIAKLVGSNKAYIEGQIPHLSSLLCDTVEEVIDDSEVIVVGNKSPEFTTALERCRADQIVIDLVRVPIPGALLKAEYRGICW